jgi:hypothetical protein
VSPVIASSATPACEEGSAEWQAISLPASCTEDISDVSLAPLRGNVVLPVQRDVFLAVPQKPPGDSFVDTNFVFCPDISPIPVILPSFAFMAVPGKIVSQRSLPALVFKRRPRIHYSFILQIDGLLHSCFRLRLERDVCALPCDVTFCNALGPGVSPASTFCGLYWPPPDLLAAVILAVKHERGYGVFIGPSSSESWKFLDMPDKTRKTSLLTFSFPGPENAEYCAHFLSFAYQGKIRRKKADSTFVLNPIFAVHIPRHIGIVPFCPARVSSLQHWPVASNDSVKRSPPLPVDLSVPLPTQVSVWNVKAMELLAPLFPHRDVAALFLQVIQPSGARLMFAGDSSKRVVSANAEMDPLILSQIRERFVSETAKGRMMGPFCRCPFPNSWNKNQARSTPLDTRKKDKYDPLSERFRVVSNFSAGRASSINNLIYSPKLLSAHLQSSQLRDILFSLGANARFSAIDQQDAFRADHVNLADAHLYCYQVGKEWYIDLRDPFGNIKSEYAYAIIVAVLKWAFECNRRIVDGSSSLLGYVDNWFLVSSADDASHDERWRNLKSVFDHLGAPMHEEQCSLKGIVNALGWDWDLASNLFRCPDDKYKNCLRLSKEWSRRATSSDFFSFNEIESIAGLFQWISTACPAIVPAVASIQAFKHVMKLSGALKKRLDDRCSAAVVALASFFESWDKSCRLFAGFSPVAQWEVLIRVDASTDFGAGGFYLPSRECFIHKWTPDERATALAHSATPLRESTTFFELKGILLALQHSALLLKGKRVQIECDNEAAVRDLTCCFSGKPLCMIVIAQIRDFCALNFITMRVEHILAVFNNIADCLSHDLFTQANDACLLELHSPLQAPSRF